MWSSLIITRNIKPSLLTLTFFCTAYCSSNVCWRDSSVPVPKCLRDTSAGAELSGHFGTSLMVPKCLGSEVSWHPKYWNDLATLVFRKQIYHSVCDMWYFSLPGQFTPLASRTLAFSLPRTLAPMDFERPV